MSDVRWVEIGGWDGEDAEARHRREVAWAESHWSGRHPFSRFRRPNDSMEDQVSDEEGTASGAPVDVVAQAIETIREICRERDDALAWRDKWRDNYNAAVQDVVEAQRIAVEARQEVAEVRAEHDRTRAEFVQLRGMRLPVSDEAFAVAGLTRELDELRATLAQVRRDNRQAVEANDRLRRERDVLSSTLALVQQQYDEARTDRAKAIAERDAVRNDCDAVIKQRNDARDSANKIAATLDTVQKQLAKLREERAAILEMLQ